MTQQAQATAQKADSIAVTVTDPRLRRLNPADGLFLRAEHLNQIQEYAHELARAEAMAVGTGVAYGYALSLEGAALTVTPGLAIDPSGQVLRSPAAKTLDLGQLTSKAGRFWVVEVATAQPEATGSEPVFGELCADACATGGSIQPWRDDAVTIRVTPDDTLAALQGVEARYQRNWLASAYFEQERKNGRPWLTPGAGGSAKVGELVGWPWQAAVPSDEATTASAVPLGAVLLVDGAWVLDVWIARRDLGATRARSGWEAHLSRRPWELFVAQVLQFQAQLAQAPEAATADTATIAGVEQLYAELLRNPRRSKQALTELFSGWRADHQPTSAPGSLVERGFRELPSAGFLPVDAGGDDLDATLAAMFGPVRVTVRHGSADAAIRAVDEAQHLDRIPLTVEGDGSNPAVQVWVPDVVADLAALSTPAYGWVAFVRDRDPVAAPVRGDDVGVHFHQGESLEELPAFAKEVAQHVGEPPIATLIYPAGTWAVTEDDASRTIEHEYAAVVENGGGVSGLIATYVHDRDRPLAFVRAALLGIWLTASRDPELANLPTLLVKAERETIWLFLTARAE